MNSAIADLDEDFAVAGDHEGEQGPLYPRRKKAVVGQPHETLCFPRYAQER